MSKNPFEPSFGSLPPASVRRQISAKELSERLDSDNRMYKTMFITGPRGCGKTSILTELLHLKKADNWIVCNIGVGESILQDLIDLLRLHLPSQAKIQSATIFNVEIGVEPYMPTSLQVQLEQILEQLRHRKILIIIDEIDTHPRLTTLLKYYQIWLQNELPIHLVAAGLPKLLTNVQESHGITFLLRSHRVELAPLELPDVAASYKSIFKEALPNNIATELARTTGGYSYLYQLLGYFLWEKHLQIISMHDIRSTLDEILPLLYQNAYDRIFAELTPTELQFVEWVLQERSHIVTISRIIERSGRDKNFVNQYRRRLLQQGIIQSEGRGRISFALPHVRAYFEQLYD